MSCSCNPFNCSQTICCVCGDFATPTVADEGQCGPYRVKISCEAPPLPVAPCPGEVYTTIYQPSNEGYPFAVSAMLMNELCQPITDETGAIITIIIE